MNQLNSVLLEGSLSEGPFIGEADGSPVCNFTIKSVRQEENKDGVMQKSSISVRVRVWGQLAETCTRYLFPETRVRIVGRLACDSINGHREIYIAAEHVEFVKGAKDA